MHGFPTATHLMVVASKHRLLRRRRAPGRRSVLLPLSRPGPAPHRRHLHPRVPLPAPPFQPPHVPRSHPFLGPLKPCAPAAAAPPAAAAAAVPPPAIHDLGNPAGAGDGVAPAPARPAAAATAAAPHLQPPRRATCAHGRTRQATRTHTPTGPHPRCPMTGALP